MVVPFQQQGLPKQALVSFNVAAIENGFILTKVYVINESDTVRYQVQRTFYVATLNDALKSLQDDVSA